ncbi:HXXEE domain-containing protein [Paenibacillus xylaniclasticus]|uniref:HXXEE domain-containing protein n=1 Tax=Paenibacillus xylaniclasticus TaxID=588083 RepID=UPI000FD7CD5C|nr:MULTISPECIES: HXXEE domain-containing protein [Paenibacillus]GFN33566.1 hypothetical protein PCURB6_38260 [Paenibacillus curdlanolyticus]
MSITIDITKQTLIWLFIVAFLLHDLEEIIMVEFWAKKNKEKVLRKVPESIQADLSKMLTITSGQFAVAVLLEFIIFIPFTYIAAEQGKYFVFLAINSLFFLHVFTHVGQSLYLRMYTPGVVSAVAIIMPYTMYLFYKLISCELVTMKQILLSAPVGLLVIPIVFVGHELGRKIVPNYEK